MASELETGTEDLLGRIEDRTAVLTFNRPDRRNALSSEMYDAFDRALPQIAADTNLRVLMVTGAGGAFCAGGDVKRMNDNNQSGGHTQSMDDRVADLRRRQRAVSMALHELPMPVVAAIPGACAGAGMSIALAADLRIASPKALMVTAFANVGASGDFGGSWFLTHLVGAAKAKELYFRSPRLTADEALDLGLVNAIIGDEDPASFEAAALDWCGDIATETTIAMARLKENLNRAATADLATALDAEAVNMAFTMSTADPREAAAAFVEKRTPVFSGE